MVSQRFAFMGLIAPALMFLGTSVPVSAQNLQETHSFMTGKWQRIADFPDPHEEMFGAAANGKLYVFGGFIPFWKVAGSFSNTTPVPISGLRKSTCRVPRTTWR